MNDNISGFFFAKLLIAICVWTTYTIIDAEPLEGDRVKYAKIYDQNFVVALARINSDKSRVSNVFCTGALISPALILTNEHCIRKKAPENVVAYIGSVILNEALEYSICKWKSYHDWRNNEQLITPADYGLHDLAIAKLCINVDPSVSRPGLFSWIKYNQVEKSSFTMIGWGTVESGFSSEFMREAKVKMYDQEKCVRITNMRSTANHKFFCTSATPAVLAGDGDSGGPLLDSDMKIVGVTSATWVIPRSIKDSLNLHANVTYYKDFITSMISEY
ncbi:hypothetical protein QAD02_008996 [Eretmocerus hayati]|uniref:Uncharacterized protein n=1 Tax=Eretmocerus hayati TaxID=131215 RepID=A0ACC2N8F3_9HYME|nr:hypothetical protein QAD02_008996 [Eretmocerus hayati]